MDLVAGADAGKDAVHHADTRLVRGHKLPICAISEINATWRKKVLLPAMFGPVSTWIAASGVIRISLGTNGSSVSVNSTTGCRPA